MAASPTAPLVSNHPCACGEQCRAAYVLFENSKSSPRVRGADHRPRRWGNAQRIIHARAGSSTRSGRRSPSWRDHPRACGEQRTSYALEGSRYGSSPRVRGAEEHEVSGLELGRIIPARAGSREARPPSRRSGQDHPHACGEQFLRALREYADLGSSPRVRGAAMVGARASQSLGIIPARAGSSAPMAST